MIKRLCSKLVNKRLTEYPAVALVGPRQSGKTTLAKSIANRYYDLEKEQDRLRIDVEWETLLSETDPIVLDEAQEMPEVFTRLRSAIDEDRARNGRFLLLGSVAPSLMTQVSESLAGRLSISRLSPFLSQELSPTRQKRLWSLGGYPDGGIQKPTQYPHWQQSYLELLAQRDLPHWGLPVNPSVTMRLFRMLAALNGQLWNASQIGKSLGLSYHTVSKYVDFLEQAFLVRRLPAYASNIKKRLVKSPKVYWRDSGLLHALLGFTPKNDLLTQPWVGASWEGWVIEQLLSYMEAQGLYAQPSFLRTSDQHEIDLLLEYQGALWAFEIKLTSSPAAQDLEKLATCAKLVHADKHFLISQTRRPVYNQNKGSINLQTCLELLST